MLINFRLRQQLGPKKAAAGTRALLGLLALKTAGLDVIVANYKTFAKYARQTINTKHKSHRALWGLLALKTFGLDDLANYKTLRLFCKLTLATFLTDSF